MDFNSEYRGTPPWDIGRPQSEIVALEKSGKIVGDVLDIGCGTGENALFLASKDHKVVGIDVAELAIKRAREKSASRNIEAEFKLWDALLIDKLGTRFNTVIDCGLFHTLDDDDRIHLEIGLKSTVKRGGRYFMLAFSDREPGRLTIHHRRVTKGEIRETFAVGWRIEEIEEAKIEDRHEGKHEAWLSTIKRV